MVAWLKLKDRKARETAPVSAAMDAEISHFMFHHYCHWFSKNDVAEAFACIPQVGVLHKSPLSNPCASKLPKIA